MNNRPPMGQAVPRIRQLLQLKPMSRQRLETCLSLHRTSVIEALSVMQEQREVRRIAVCTAAYGAWPDEYALTNNQTIAGETP